MAKNDKIAKEMDWDDGISAEVSTEEFAVLPVGEYTFEVVDWEKTISSSGHKMAKLTLEIVHNGIKYKIWDNLVLIESMKWKLAMFFESLGLKKKGTELKSMPWSNIMDRPGRVKVKHEEYNGQTVVRVDKYLPSLASEADTAPGGLPFEV